MLMSLILYMSWDGKWTWKHPDFYTVFVSYTRLNGNCYTLSSPAGNIVWMALRRGDEEPKVDSALAQRLIYRYRYAVTACCVMLLPLLLTLRVGSASPSVASPAERDDLLFRRL